MMDASRIEKDALGEVLVPRDKYWGAQTQRSCQNFAIGTECMPMEIIRAFAIVKKAAALSNERLGKLDAERCQYICAVCDEILSGKLDAHFPLKVWQTGSGTQTNMNLNEVIANRGNELAQKRILHPNDHVNMSQSSNDTFPTAMSIAGVQAIVTHLLPALSGLTGELSHLESLYPDAIKIGRTHLQDATPIRFSQEVSGWRSMLLHDADMISKTLEPLRELALGGTAVGTGINAPPEFGETAAGIVSSLTGDRYITAPNKFHALTSKDQFVFAHGAIKALACDLLKIANDVRWLASGPLCGLGEITIPANEPGSSIMPGKVNPTQCEAVTMVACQVMANDVAVSLAASQGNFELNVYMPVCAYNFLQSVRLLGDAIRSFTKNCVSGIAVNYDRMNHYLQRSPMLVTVLAPVIGYDNASKIAEKSLSENITLREAALALGLLSGEEFDRYMQPEKMV